MTNPIRVSIVIPIYDEKENLRPLYDQIMAVAEKLDGGYEIIFVNDGSKDGSDIVLSELADENENVRVINLRRNFGQTAALMAGIAVNQGEVIVTMDGDMQNDPADIPRLLDKMEEGFEVVSGWRKDREDNRVLRILPSVIANRLISKIFGVHLHDYGCTLKAYGSDVIRNVRLYGEMHRYIPIYASWEGARVAELPVAHHARRHGKSKYGLGRIFRVFLDVILLYFMDRAFDRPIQFFGKLAGLSWLIAFCLGLWALWMKFAEIRDLVQSPLPLLVVSLALAGLMFILLGVLSEMQMRTYFEGQGRTPYSIRSTRNLEKDNR